MLIDIGMGIACDDDGKLQINHWPPLAVEDSVPILQILDVSRLVFVISECIPYWLTLETYFHHGRDSQSDDLRSMSTSIRGLLSLGHFDLPCYCASLLL